jgi:two-component system cell cycle response regulator
MATAPNTSTILVADDNVGHLKVLELVLTGYDFDTVTAHNGEEAYHYLRDNTPDLIILDINMPFMDGLEVCRRAKAIERLTSVPIIIMTSLTDEKTKGKVRDAGADLLIHKPIAGRTLQGHIHDLLAARAGDD